MRETLRVFFRSLLRVYPRCVTQAQAVALNLFLAFFPMLLLALGLFSISIELHAEIQELTTRLRRVLPQGSQQLVLDLMTRTTTHPWQWILVGSLGTLLAGTQAMKLMMDGFRIVRGESDRPPFWVHQVRALFLLAAAIGPGLATVVLTVFGKQVRRQMIHVVGMPVLIRGLWAIVYFGVTLLFAVLLLALIYRVGTERVRSWGEVLPGAIVATLLWLLANAGFGLYVRNQPYGVIYGGLAGTIVLLAWMQLSAMIVFLGAAYNAERLAGSFAKPATGTPASKGVN